MERDIETETVRKTGGTDRTHVDADVCVLGAGISGMSAALEAAKAGADVVVADAEPHLGGQAVGSIIGTIVGLYSHGEEPYQLTYGIADDVVEDLVPRGDAAILDRGDTYSVQYDETALQRWMERRAEELGVRPLLGAILTDVAFEDRRVEYLDFVTRYGPVRVAADGFVDASGDASLTYEAGLEVREPDAPIYGSMNFLVENYDVAAASDLDVEAVRDRLAEVGDEYGLVREDGHLMPMPGKEFMLANVTHIETPRDPMGYADMVFEGRRQADATVDFLRNEFPGVFEGATVRRYGNPGIRQTRWITSRDQLTLEDLRRAERPEDAIGRGSHAVELHDTPEEVSWEHFEAGHVYYIPLSCMVPEGVDNVVAAGRCIDADVEALSAIRVMGICIAMGMGAAHALDLAGTDPVYGVDVEALQRRLRDNLERTDRVRR